MLKLKPITAALLLGLSQLIAGCALIPSAGPTRSEVEAPPAPSEDLSRRYFIIDVNQSTLSTLTRFAPTSFSGQFSDYRPASVQRIGIGDFIQVTIWEAAAGGLFSAAVVDRSGTGSRSAVIPEQQVGQDGSITVPYAGRIRVAGNSPAAIERLIVSRLEGQAIQPQALVTITRHVTNTATVIGEVTTGGRVPLSARGDRILDVIASAGGVRASPHETFVRLSRNGRTVSMPLQALVQRPQENIIVRPSDVLTVVRQPQTFVATGATGRNAIVPFEAVGMSLLEGVASAGGLLDMRADPEGVFLMRTEPQSVAAALGLPPEVLVENNSVRVVYRLNMRDTNAVFVARQFQLRDKDVLYVASAPLNELQKVLQIFSLAAQPVVTGVTVGNAVRR